MCSNKIPNLLSHRRINKNVTCDFDIWLTCWTYWIQLQTSSTQWESLDEWWCLVYNRNNNDNTATKKTTIRVCVFQKIKAVRDVDLGNFILTIRAIGLVIFYSQTKLTNNSNWLDPLVDWISYRLYFLAKRHKLTNCFQKWKNTLLKKEMCAWCHCSWD